MKTLHIITPSSRMMKTFVDTIQQAFPNDEHIFYTTKNIPKSENSFFESENMIHMEGGNRYEKMMHLKSYCDSADTVIWHGFLYPFRLMLFLYMNRTILAKSVWIMWGIDLYNWKIPGFTPKKLVMNHINKVCRKKVGVVVALLDPDVDVYREQFGNSANIIVAPYPISYKSFEMMNQRKSAKPRANGIVNIQIGNNAHSFNNHHRVLDALKTKDADNLQYFFPLSYGDDKDWKGNAADYANKLIERTNETYEKRAHYLLKMMDQEEYTSYLWGIDIAIFDADRQNALGNMLKLMYMGSKVYLSPLNPLYDFFKSKGIDVYNARNIETESSDEFFSCSNPKGAIDWITETYYPPMAIKKWGPIFDKFRNGESVPAATITEVDQRPLSSKSFARKPSFLSTAPYSSRRRALPSDWHYAILSGDIDTIAIVADSVLESEPQWFLAGTTIEDDFSLEELHAALGYYSTIDEFDMYPSRAIILPAYKRGASRKTMIKHVYGEDELHLDDGRALSFTAKMSHTGFGSTIGFMSIITSETRIMPGVTIGNGVLICAARIGVNSVIDDYATIMSGASIGAHCRIGREAYIGENVCIPDNTTIKDGAVITTSI